ncbi:MAG: zinc-ribbon domain-containing protein [Candidatus Omnitrophota bacterium]|nr:MAG: zinc-ribbon domain-containing protein [Candidatus Omnitrophota bacterium]
MRNAVTNNCPHCQKPIYDDDALLCLYCGESLSRDVGVLGKLKYYRPRIIIALIVLLIVSAFVILIIR